MVFDLLPQLADINAQIVRIFGVSDTPDGGQNLGVCHDLSSVLRQK